MSDRSTRYFTLLSRYSYERLLEPEPQDPLERAILIHRYFHQRAPKKSENPKVICKWWPKCDSEYCNFWHPEEMCQRALYKECIFPARFCEYAHQYCTIINGIPQKCVCNHENPFFLHKKF